MNMYCIYIYIVSAYKYHFILPAPHYKIQTCAPWFPPTERQAGSA